MKTNKANKGIRVFGLGRVLAGLVLAGAVLSWVGDAHAVKFSNVCDNNISTEHRAAVEDVVEFLGRAAEDILVEVDVDPNNRNFVDIEEKKAAKWLGEVEDLVAGKIPIACHEAGQWDGTIVNCSDTNRLGWTLYGKIHLCLENWENQWSSDPVMLADTIAHELMHHVDLNESHKKGCWAGTNQEYQVATNGLLYPGWVSGGISVLPEGVHIARCRKLKNCPSAATKCKDRMTYPSNPDSLSETIGLAARDVAGHMPEIEILSVDTVRTGSDPKTYDVIAEVRLSNGTHRAFTNLALWVYSPYESRDLDTLAPGESRWFQFRGPWEVVPAEDFVSSLRVYLREPGHGEYREVFDSENFTIPAVVEFPIVPLNAIVDRVVTGKSGVECGDAPGSPGLQSDQRAFFEADSKVDARLSHRCFGGDKPSELILGGMFGNGPLSSATSWDDYCAETCEAKYPSAVGVTGSAKVIDKTVSLLWEQEVPNACGAGGGSPFVAPHGGSASYSAYQARLEGTGTCGCSCELG